VIVKEYVLQVLLAKTPKIRLRTQQTATVEAPGVCTTLRLSPKIIRVLDTYGDRNLYNNICTNKITRTFVQCVYPVRVHPVHNTFFILIFY